MEAFFMGAIILYAIVNIFIFYLNVFC